ncbi:unnamed protein product, partial [Mesorhabditis belari]|uniref:Transposase n=1 Tax=Mesorhabditis belari TaxID=2138241 RepID=A0AAF3FQ45_9BILA
MHGKKVMLCIWWNSKGLVYFEVLDLGQRVTGDLYKAQLSRVDQALRRQGNNAVTTKFLHDNTRPHTAKSTQQKPGLGPIRLPVVSVDAALFSRNKFKNREEVEIWVSNFFESQLPEFFEKGIHSLRGRWQRVIDNDGEYLLD